MSIFIVALKMTLFRGWLLNKYNINSNIHINAIPRLLHWSLLLPYLDVRIFPETLMASHHHHHPNYRRHLHLPPPFNMAFATGQLPLQTLLLLQNASDLVSHAPWHISEIMIPTLTNAIETFPIVIHIMTVPETSTFLPKEKRIIILHLHLHPILTLTYPLMLQPCLCLMSGNIPSRTVIAIVRDPSIVIPLNTIASGRSNNSSSNAIIQFSRRSTEGTDILVFRQSRTYLPHRYQRRRHNTAIQVLTHRNMDLLSISSVKGEERKYPRLFESAR